MLASSQHSGTLGYLTLSSAQQTPLEDREQRTLLEIPSGVFCNLKTLNVYRKKEVSPWTVEGALGPVPGTRQSLEAQILPSVWA